MLVGNLEFIFLTFNICCLAVLCNQKGGKGEVKTGLNFDLRFYEFVGATESARGDLIGGRVASKNCLTERGVIDQVSE